MQKQRRGFTIIELMVVILIVGILASISLPLMKARIDRSKWSEACTSAGTIRRAVRSYAAETSVATTQALIGNNLGDVTTQEVLGFTAEDLEGTYFAAGDYVITSVNGDGIAAITATGGSKASSPSGSYVLQANGTWTKQ